MFHPHPRMTFTFDRHTMRSATTTAQNNILRQSFIYNTEVISLKIQENTRSPIHRSKETEIILQNSNNASTEIRNRWQDYVIVAKRNSGSFWSCPSSLMIVTCTNPSLCDSYSESRRRPARSVNRGLVFLMRVNDDHFSNTRCRRWKPTTSISTMTMAKHDKGMAYERICFISSLLLSNESVVTIQCDIILVVAVELDELSILTSSLSSIVILIVCR